MTTRRTFLRLLGIGAPVAAVASRKPVSSREELLAAIYDWPESSYSDIGTDEGLADMIYNVPPTETPFMRQAKRT